MCDLAGYYAKWNLFWPIPNGIYQCMYATQGSNPGPSRLEPPGEQVFCHSRPRASTLPPCLARRFYFQAQGMPRPAMWNNLAFVLVNAALNWTFVFGGPFQYAPINWHGFGFVGAAVRMRASLALTTDPLTLPLPLPLPLTPNQVRP